MAAAKAVRTGVLDMDAHVNKAWEFFRRMGSPKFHVAPMVDQSELAFRQLCRRYGATCAYTPMLHSRLFLESAAYRAEHFTTCEADRPLLVQFCANEPATLASAAKLVQSHCDGVDLNLGCPQRIAKRGNYGAYLMDDLPLVQALVQELYHELHVPVTVKIRKFDDTAKTIEYAKMLERAGASVLAIHGRTREMKDSSKFLADWDIIREELIRELRVETVRHLHGLRDVISVKAALRIPVLANGNVRTLEDALRLMAETGADGVLSADPLLVNPALFSGKPASGHTPCDLLLEYLDHVKEFPTPMRMVKGHTHSLLGAWFKEHWDLRDRLNVDKNISTEKIREIAVELKQRIIACGRDHPVPRLTERAIARREEQLRKERLAAAIAEQAREEDAVAALDATASTAVDPPASTGAAEVPAEALTAAEAPTATAGTGTSSANGGSLHDAGGDAGEQTADVGSNKRLRVDHSEQMA